MRVRLGIPGPSDSERSLFIVVWTVVLILGGIWYFWPQELPDEASDKPQVILSQELLGLFSEAETVAASPSRYRVELVWNPQARRINSESPRYWIGYELASGTSVLAKGTLQCERGVGKFSMQIPNPERVHAQAIHLYLAR